MTNNEVCGCEFSDHFHDEHPASTLHAYCAVPAGSKRAMYVGVVCDLCAETCMKNYIIAD